MHKYRCRWIETNYGVAYSYNEREVYRNMYQYMEWNGNAELHRMHDSVMVYKNEYKYCARS